MKMKNCTGVAIPFEVGQVSTVKEVIGEFVEILSQSLLK